MITTVDDNLRTDRQAAFVREYVKDWNGTQAAIRAGYSERTADEQASRLLTNSRIRSAIDRRLKQIVAIADVDTAMVVRELLDVATADPRELVSVHRDCCRYCYGTNHRRQWTLSEYETAVREAMRDGQPPPSFEGGIGYNATREPNPECSECFGRGVETVVVADTRKLSPQAAKLYAGAQRTKDGVKALGRNQNEALIALGRYLGMFTDRSEVSGPGGGPISIAAENINLNELTDAQLAVLATGGGPALMDDHLQLGSPARTFK
jgi:phage terminase small subunit